MEVFKHFSDKSFCFYSKWVLNTNDYETKLLILFSINHNNGKQFIGTLKDICINTGYSYSNNTLKEIKKALNNLVNRNFITLDKKGYKYYISLIVNDEEDLLYFRYCWIDKIKSFNKDENGKPINKNKSIEWAKIVRVFAYVFLLAEINIPFSQVEVASKLKMSSNSFGRAYKAITQMKLQDIYIKKDRAYKYITDDAKFRCIGSKLDFGLGWDKDE